MLGALSRVLPAPVKRVLKPIYELLRRTFMRPLGLIFFSPSTALRAACRQPPSLLSVVALRSTIGEIKSVSGISIHENVVSYPVLRVNRQRRFLGGLADAATRTLIHEAVHYNGQAYAQSLPASHIEEWARDDCVEIRQPVLYGGMLFSHFGHFVLESICRLYAYPLVRKMDPHLLFHLPDGVSPRYLERHNFARQILAGFGIPVEKLILIDRVATIKTIIIPTQRYGFGFLHRPDDVFVEFVRSFRYRHAVPRGFSKAEKIYVSRSHQKRGALIGEKRFEEYLANQGYKIFYPERHALFEQLTLYAGAKKIIFSEGSALLSCVLLPDLEADVAVVCRRRDPHRSARVATDCLQGYGKRILWLDAVRGQYALGLDVYEALADVDWHAVSRLLHERGFVDKVSQVVTGQEHSTLARSAIQKYLRDITADPRFVDYLLSLRETHPPWVGPSHLVDPRDGLPICPLDDSTKEG